MRGWDVRALVTLCVTGDDSMMFQTGGVCVAGLQSASSKIPWLPIVTDGVEEEEILDLERGLSGMSNPAKDFNLFWPDNWESEGIVLHEGELEIDALVSGALRSDYQRTRIERMCSNIGIKSFSPLWHHSPNEHIRSLPRLGFEVRISSVTSDGLDSGWVGRQLGVADVEELIGISSKFRFNADGEGGEYETLVLASPHMKKRIILDGKVSWQRGRGSWNISSGRLSSNR
tara:strand:+ start:1361 stop:2050 length:690 start_codon:yes stop_codon:yes gene_type:complete